MKESTRLRGMFVALVHRLHVEVRACVKHGVEVPVSLRESSEVFEEAMNRMLDRAHGAKEEVVAHRASLTAFAREAFRAREVFGSEKVDEMYDALVEFGLKAVEEA